MRRLILIFVIGFLALFQPGFAAEKSSQSFLQASLSTERTKVSELEAYDLSISFALTNTGKTAVELRLADTQVFMNGRDIGRLHERIFGFGQGTDLTRRDGKPATIAPGEKQDFFIRLDDLGKPGTYNFTWKSKVFQSKPLKITVLPDRVMGDGKEPKHFALIRAIRKQLPQGWQAFGESWPIGDMVTVVRSQPIVMHRPYVPNDNPFNKEPVHPYPFYFTLITEPLVSPANYRQIKLDNETIRQKLMSLEQQMKTIPTHKGEYFPKKPEDEKQVEEFNELAEKRRQLPEFYFGDISLSFRNFNMNNERYSYQRVQDKAIREECQEVTQRVINLLTSYEPQEPLPKVEDYD